MRFSMLAVSVLVTMAAASPIGSRTTSKEKAAASAAAAAAACPAVAAAAASATADVAASASTASAASGAALVSSAYNTFQISSGTAGTGEDEANALFTSIDQNDLANVSADDLKIIQGIHDAAEDAEVDAFNPAIAAASGDEADALQRGKIKNKILKLTAEVLSFKIKAAQGDADASAEADAEQTKLTNNIATDTKDAGLASTAVSFDATS